MLRTYIAKKSIFSIFCEFFHITFRLNRQQIFLEKLGKRAFEHLKILSFLNSIFSGKFEYVFDFFCW